MKKLKRKFQRLIFNLKIKHQNRLIKIEQKRILLNDIYIKTRINRIRAKIMKGEL